MRATSFRTIVVTLITLLMAWSSPAIAQPTEAPSDVSLARSERNALPPAPDGYVSREDGSVRWDLPEEARAGEIVDQLQDIVRIEWPRIERELGAEIDDDLVIRVARNPDEMRALAPPQAPPPAYAVGVAYPASGLVLLTLSAPETWERPDLEQVLVHELSHVALHRAVGGRPVPRWLTEGIAIHHAHERSLERMQALWDATVRGTLIPLDDLSRSFPARPHRVGIAYAESADFVEWLFRRGEGGGEKVRELVGRMRRGQEFETAVSQTWSAGIGQLEHEWREGLAERYGAMPLLLGTGAIWLVISLLLVIAWARRRRDSRRTLRRWETEEAEEARVLARAQALAELRARAAEARQESARLDSARLESARQVAALESPDDDEEDDDDEDDVVIEIRDRDPHLPTIRWEGRDHTVH